MPAVTSCEQELATRCAPSPLGGKDSYAAITGIRFVDPNVRLWSYSGHQAPREDANPRACHLMGSCYVISSVIRRHALTDAQWEQIKDLLPGRAEHVGAPAKNNRLFVDAVLYRYRCGIAWRDLPQRFGDFRVVHLRHMRWSRSGVWLRVFEALSALPDNEYAMIDATIVRAHQHSAGAKGGAKAKPSVAAEEV